MFKSAATLVGTSTQTSDLKDSRLIQVNTLLPLVGVSANSLIRSILRLLKVGSLSAVAVAEAQ